MADEVQLVSLFQNLLSNAIKYRAEDRPLCISIHSQPSNTNHYQLTVRDNGIGIAPDYHQKIFEIFQRLKTSNSADGTGIGLTICQRIVRRFGGTIWVESSEGNGAAFHFTLHKAEHPPT